MKNKIKMNNKMKENKNEIKENKNEKGNERE